MSKNQIVNESDFQNILKVVFKQAYNLGKEDMLEGIHISSDVLFKQLLENNDFKFDPQLFESMFLDHKSEAC